MTVSLKVLSRAMDRLECRSELERQRALLLQVVEDISGDLALGPLLSRIVERACTLIGAKDGAIGLYEREMDCIRTAANCNIPEAQVTPVLPRGWGLLGRVLELDAPVHCRYADLPHPTRVEALEMDMIGMPIRIRGELIGVFGIGAHHYLKFDDFSLELLAHFARYAALAIDNAKRHALEQRRTAHFSLIVRVAGIIASSPDIDSALQRAADAVHELLGYPNIDIPLIDVNDPETLVIRFRAGDHKRLIPYEDRLSIDRGIMGAAVRERRAQLVNHVMKDPRYVTPPGVTGTLAELAVPILSGDDVLGVLNVESDQTFDDLDLDSLEVVADNLALAIQGAKLREQSRQLAVLEERQRLARELHDNVTQILSSISMISQSLEDSWQRSAAEGVIRTARLGQLAEMGFSELRELLAELSPVTSPRPAPGSHLRHDTVGVMQMHQQGFAVTVEHMVSAMLPSHISHMMRFTAYLPQALEHERALLRICQEAASNAIRHAQASNLEIEAGVEEDHVWLRIADDGRGFSPSSVAGMGISNMWHRLFALGGAFHMAARLPTGTQMEARLPRQDRMS